MPPNLLKICIQETKPFFDYLPVRIRMFHKKIGTTRQYFSANLLDLIRTPQALQIVPNECILHCDVVSYNFQEIIIIIIFL